MTDWICPHCDGGFPNEVVEASKGYDEYGAQCPFCGTEFETFGVSLTE